MTLCQLSKTLRKQFLSKNLIELLSCFLYSNNLLKVLENGQSVVFDLYLCDFNIIEL